MDSPRAAMESFIADGLVPELEHSLPGAGGSPTRRPVAAALQDL